ncbi:hypothetical protein D3C72_2036240 [compost metagenome]
MTLSAAPPAWAIDLPVPVDKAAHFGISYAVTDQLIRLGATPEQAVGITIFGGWLKEVLDRQFDPYDMAADVAGALAAGYLRVELKF